MAKSKNPNDGTALMSSGRENGGGRKTIPQRFPGEYAKAQERIALYLGPLALQTLERVMRGENDAAAVSAAEKVLSRFIPTERDTSDTPRLQLIISTGSRILREPPIEAQVRELPPPSNP